MNKAETIKLFTLISNAYDMFEISEEKIEVWSYMLHDQVFEDVLSNFKSHANTERYPPSISDLRGARPLRANNGYLDKNVVLRLEGMKSEALKRIPEEHIPDFIKRARGESKG